MDKLKQKVSNVIRVFNKNKNLSAQALIAAFAVTSIVYFAKVAGANGLPEAITLYIASGVGIESLGIVLGKLLEKKQVAVEDNDVLLVLENAYRNGELDKFASSLSTKQDLQIEISNLMNQLGVLEYVLIDAMKDQENSIVERTLLGFKIFNSMLTEDINETLEKISLNATNLATKSQAASILSEIDEIKKLLKDPTIKNEDLLLFPSSNKAYLSDEENRKLNKILRNLPSLFDTKRRVNFIDSAGLMNFVDRLEFEGTSYDFAQQLVRVLYDYGRMPNGRLAICNLLTFLLELIEGQEENVAFVKSLSSKFNC